MMLCRIKPEIMISCLVFFLQERLYARGEITRGDVPFDLPQTRSPLYEDIYSKPSSLWAPYTDGSGRASPNGDHVTAGSQLLAQAKMITSLHQAVTRLERDRDQHQQRIRSLEDDVRRLRGPQGDTHGASTDRKLEELRQDLFSEIKRLQERERDVPSRDAGCALRSTASVLQEVNESKRALWSEFESLRRDMDYLHQRLRRQEEDLLRQLAESQDVKRAQDRNAKVLEGVLSGQQTHTMDITRARTETQDVQRDLLQIRSSISELKDDVRVLEDQIHRHGARSGRAANPASRKKKPVESPSPSSEDDSSPQVSLADISSEDTSCSLGVCAASYVSKDKSSSSRRELRSQEKTTSTLNGDDLSDYLDQLSDSPPELNFSDL
uniref:Uncharacterized protein n=1 Tax=Leptobrachium leishanense TaxID=445787 RepID=A0A8C5Q0Y1_9ANUR